MEIRIANYIAASFLLEREPQQWHALVILDSGSKATGFLATHALSALCLRFDDVEEPRANKQAPTKALLEQALHFARGKDKLLVSCRAGQGRSAALAYVIGCREHGTTTALQLLDPTRHRPNRLVIALGETLLTNMAVLDPFEAWRRQHAHIQLSDHYAEIEKELDALEAQGATNRICES